MIKRPRGESFLISDVRKSTRGSNLEVPTSSQKISASELRVCLGRKECNSKAHEGTRITSRDSRGLRPQGAMRRDKSAIAPNSRTP